MSTTVVMPTAGRFSSKSAFEGVLEHWANSRLDGPLEIIARFDGAAKQLIAISGFMQSVFFAVIALHGLKDKDLLWLAGLFFIPLIALVFCAARVICTVPLKLEAHATYHLMRNIGEPDGISDNELEGAIHEWCTTIDSLALRKHRWLFAANVLFITSSIGSVILLTLLMKPS